MFTAMNKTILTVYSLKKTSHWINAVFRANFPLFFFWVLNFGCTCLFWATRGETVDDPLLSLYSRRPVVFVSQIFLFCPYLSFGVLPRNHWCARPLYCLSVFQRFPYWNYLFLWTLAVFLHTPSSLNFAAARYSFLFFIKINLLTFL